MDFDLKRVELALSSTYHRFDNYSDKILLIDFLSKNIPDLNNWEEKITLGGIYINGLRADKNQILPNPAKVEYYKPKYDLSNITHWTYHKHTIYEDDYFCIIFKPENLSSMPAKEQKLISLWHDLALHFGEDIHLPSRLDYATSGLLLFSKQPEHHKLFQQLFEKKEIQKYYLFESEFKSDWNEKFISLKINKTPIHPILRVADEFQGLDSETNFKKLSEEKNCLYLAQPLTGRTHQIRVHAASQGISIIGDNFYSGKVAKSLHLLSYKVSFTHPITKKTLNIVCPDELLPDWVQEHKISAL